MNSIISNARFEPSEETQLRMAAYNAQVMDMIFDAMTKPRAQPGISDDDMANERKAQDIFYPALAAFRTACIAAANLSELRRDAITDTLAYAEDNRPGRGSWDEEIAGARRGY